MWRIKLIIKYTVIIIQWIRNGSGYFEFIGYVAYIIILRKRSRNLVSKWENLIVEF